jgi:isocitrate/isopropylmalate dehydrogenase
VADILLITRQGTEHIIRFAFEVERKCEGAPADGVRRVTCVEKSNVLQLFAFFREIFLEFTQDYLDIEAETIYSDAAAQTLVQNPAHYDVLLMVNLLGDILSDLGGRTIGGLGMYPSGNINDKYAYFEPIHDSAPDIAGKGIANPLSQILSNAMLLEHIGETAAGQRIKMRFGKHSRREIFQSMSADEPQKEPRRPPRPLLPGFKVFHAKKLRMQSIPETVSKKSPNRHSTIAPGYLLSFLVGSSIVRNGHFINTPFLGL